MDSGDYLLSIWGKLQAQPKRPLLLDVFCGAGGAATGYHRAGFDIVGVDIVHQPNYPFTFIQFDALMFLQGRLGRYDMIHASPPCQADSIMSACRPGLAQTYPQFIATTRTLLQASGLPYVIENVVGAPLLDPIELCGTMFGRELYRHRLFESNVPLRTPAHPAHTKPSSRAGHWEPGTVMSVAGNCAPLAYARQIMEINWSTREELVEAIPPYYTEYLGNQILRRLT